LAASEELIYYVGDKSVSLPDIFDLDGDQVNVKADLTLAKDLF